MCVIERARTLKIIDNGLVYSSIYVLLNTNLGFNPLFFNVLVALINLPIATSSSAYNHTVRTLQVHSDLDTLSTYNPTWL